MADAKKTEESPQAAPKKSSMVKTIIIALVMVLVPAVVAVALVVFVVLPRTPAKGEHKEAEKTEHAEEALPEGIVTVDFPEAQVNVLPDTPGGPAPILTYAVSMAFSGGEEGKKLIEEHKSWFTSMLGKLHRNRTRAELNDPQVEESILKQAKQEATALLKKLSPESEIKVVEVMHTKFAIFDL